VSGLLPDYLDLFRPEKMNKVVVSIFAKITVPVLPIEGISNDIFHSAEFGFEFQVPSGDCGFEPEIS
jgi:hypothetical protein